MAWLTFAFWLTFCLVLAYAQGRLLPTLRAEPPASPAAKRNNAALHGWLTAAYLLPLALAPASWPVALLARLLVFDPAVNAGAGAPLFQVGQTAAFDRALQWLAARLHWPAPRLRLALWLAAVPAAAGFYYCLR